MQYFRTYIYGKPFTIATDHRPLKWLLEHQHTSTRLTRWGLILQEYDVTIVYTPGKENKVADALSRLPNSRVGAVLTRARTKVLTSPDTQTADVTTEKPKLVNCKAKFLPAADNYGKFAKAQREDKFINEIRIKLENGTDTSEIYKLIDNLVFRNAGNKLKLVVPSTFKSEIMKSNHDDLFGSHLGPRKTVRKISTHYFWPRMISDIKEWVKTCASCQTKKGSVNKNRVPLQPIPVGEPFDRIAIDCLGPLPVAESGNKHIVVFAEYLTKWVEAFAVPDITAPTIADLLIKNILCRHGAPKVILTDQGTNFTSEIIAEVCKLLNTTKVNTTPYNPKCDGLVEKFNHTLATMLSMYVSTKQTDWDIYLPFCIFAYNTSVQASTKDSPFYLLYGRDPYFPSDICLFGNVPSQAVRQNYSKELSEKLHFAWDLARKHIGDAQNSQKLYYDKKSKPTKFLEGDRVMLYRLNNLKKRTKKLCHPWKGPFRIIKLTSTTAILRSCDYPRNPTFKVNINHLKPFYGPYVPRVSDK